MIQLTEKQLYALRVLSRCAATPWAFGSTTVHKLCMYGFAERVRHDVAGRTTTTLHITPQGLAYLAQV